MNILIIGASSGIGRELALLYAGEGHNVKITGRRETLLSETASGNTEKISYAVFDLQDETKSAAALNELAGEKENWDLIIYSAGAGELNEPLEFELEKKSIEVNVTAFTRVACWAYHYFLKNGKGHFAAISSVAGLRGNRIAPAYNASKAYQINYLEGLRQKSRHSGHKVSITDIRPGSVNTDMMKGDGHFWIASPQEAATQIKRALAKKRRYCYITRRWGIVARILNLLPSVIYERM